MQVLGPNPGQVELPAVAEIRVRTGLIVQRNTLQERERFNVDPRDRQIQAISSLDRNIGLADRQ